VGALALSDVLLNHAGVNTNLELLDEPLQFVAREGMQDLCNFLAERARQNKRTIWLVDHLSTPSAQFAGMTTIIRGKDGFSTIGE
jgi:ABC-type Mn2+/Zn2+ transport system ATPase subunit